MDKKTDNHNLAAKLGLRRYFLEKYHADGLADVVDCCQGDGVLWGILRKQHAIARYVGMDVKKRKGRLQMDSARYLENPGWRHDVIDVDTYGEPWKHWIALQGNLKRPATVFLTVGTCSVGGSAMSPCVRQSVGLTDLKVPNGIAVKITRQAIPWLLFASNQVRVVEAVEAVSDGNARYIGVRVEPLPKGDERG